MSIYQVRTPSGTTFSVAGSDSDMAVMAASIHAQEQGLASCRAELHLDDQCLGTFDLEGVDPRPTATPLRKGPVALDTLNFETVAWHSYSDSGAPSGYSKRHLVDGNNTTTLCGQTIPSTKDRELADGYAQSDDCKACARAAARY